MGLLDRYILKTVATPLVISLCVAGMLLLLEQMLRLFDFVLAEQGPVDVVWRMLANLLPHYLSLALPLGAFLGVLLAFRNLSLSSELDAMNASGASFGRLLRPIYGLLGALMVLDFLLVGYVQPYAGYQYRQIRFDVTNGAFGLRIPQGDFVDIAEDVTIRFGAIDAETRQARDIFLETREDDGRRQIVTAQTGSVAATPGADQVLLKLNAGRQLIVGANAADVQSLDFDSFDLTIDLPSISAFRPRGGDEDEATFNELRAFLSEPANRGSELWPSYRAGFHWRLIHPLTFLAMPILAIATGVTGRRRASSIKPIIGIAVLIVYHELLEEWGQVVAAEGRLSPYVSMWGLLAAFVGVSAWLYTGSIDKARTSKVMARRAARPIRVGKDGGISEGSPDPRLTGAALARRAGVATRANADADEASAPARPAVGGAGAP